MSHELMDNDNMMYVQNEGRPWHGLGTPVEHIATSAEALTAASLDWQVELRPCYTEGVVDNFVKNIRVPENQVMVRADPQDPLAVVGLRYHPIQNTEAFDLMDDIVGQKLAMYHTAGSLKNGRLVWISARLPEQMVIQNKDAIDQYLLCYNSHDGSKSLEICFTPVRVVCQNTLNAALRNAQNRFKIRHTRNFADKIEEAKAVLGLARDYFAEFEAKANWLAEQPFTKLQMQAVVEQLMPSKDDEKVATRTQNNRNKVIELFSGKAMGSELFPGTAWQAYNAVTEYADYHKGTRGDDTGEGRLYSTLFGSAVQMKDKGLEIIEDVMQMAA